MSDINFTPLYYFMNENVSVVEIKRNDLSESATKEETYFWFRLDASQNITRLKFVSMDSEVVNGNNINIRIFDNGELRFDDKFAKFTYNGDGSITMNVPVTEIPTTSNTAIQNYFSKL